MSLNLQVDMYSPDHIFDEPSPYDEWALDTEKNKVLIQMTLGRMTDKDRSRKHFLVQKQKWGLSRQYPQLRNPLI